MNKTCMTTNSFAVIAVLTSYFVFASSFKFTDFIPLHKSEIQAVPTYPNGCIDPDLCNGHGSCTTNNTVCECSTCWATSPFGDRQCDYEQLSATGIFFGQFFIGWFTGLGFFLFKNNLYGIVELLLFWIHVMVLLLFSVRKIHNYVFYYLSEPVCAIICYLWAYSIIGFWIYGIDYVLKSNDVNGMSTCK